MGVLHRIRTIVRSTTIPTPATTPLDALIQSRVDAQALGAGLLTVGNEPLPPLPARTVGYGPVFACYAARALAFAEATPIWQEHANGAPGPYAGTGGLEPLLTPWPGGTWRDLAMLLELDVARTGNSYWWPTTVDDQPQLVRVPADQVRVLWTPGPGGTGHRVEGYVIGPADADPTGLRLLAPGELAHYAPIPDPSAPWRGMSWVSACIGDVEGDHYLARHKISSLRNRASPTYIVTFPPEVTQETVTAFSTGFLERYQGPDKSGKPAFLGGGADVRTVGLSWKDLDAKAIAGAGETRIAAAAGVPPAYVGFSEGLGAVSYASYAAMRRRFADGTLAPLWRATMAALAPTIPARPGHRLWYDPRDVPLLQDDRKDEAFIRSLDARTLQALIVAGFNPDTAVQAVASGDTTLLIGNHTGMVSVQLQADPPPDPTNPDLGDNP